MEKGCKEGEERKIKESKGRKGERERETEEERTGR